jgi:hypothetical protein
MAILVIVTLWNGNTLTKNNEGRLNKMTTIEKTFELQNRGYEFHHTAYAAGYVSRKTDGYLVKYEGKFGKGYKWLHPNSESTQYCYVTYIIKRKIG